MTIIKTMMALIFFVQTTWAGPFVSGGDPTTTPITSGLVDGYNFQGDLSKAKIIITLVNASLADAPAPVLLKITYESAQKFPLYFTLSGIQDLSLPARYLVEVLVDVDGDGKISSGDYVNRSATPIRPFDPNGFAYISLVEVK